MSFEKDSSQATPNRFVVFPEDAPVTVSEVVEPSLNGPVVRTPARAALGLTDAILLGRHEEEQE